MYTKRGKVYADPYKMIESDGIRAYQAQGKADDFIEIDCPIDDMSVRHDIATWGGGKVAFLIPKERTYEAIKTRLIKMRYTNDDQLAIMLNGESDDMQRMQAWRDWAGSVTKAICRLIGIKN